MKISRRYKLTLEDESHLRGIGTWHFSRRGLWLRGVALVLVLLFVAGLLVMVTPIRTLLPGYMKASERSATEEGLMRLDSLMAAYEVTQNYIDNYIRVTDPNRQPEDTAGVTASSHEMTIDSLQGPSNLEQRFVSQMAERERYNISVLAPLAADGVMFSPITADAVFTAATRDTEAPVVILPADENIQCTADGTVIALYHSGSEGGYVMVVQHGRGFVTSYAGIGKPLIGIGDNVSAGQVVALAPTPDSRGVSKMTLRMWHNGLALKPYEYIGISTRRRSAPEQTFDAPRGR